MNRESMWTSAGQAMELGLIRFVCEWQIAFYQAHDRYPSPAEIQQAYHAHQHGHDVLTRPGDAP